MSDLAIPAPYLLYIGAASDPADIKTSRGLATFRLQHCIGEFRHASSTVRLGLPAMTPSQAIAAGAKTLILGIAMSGGRLTEPLIEDALVAIGAGLNIASGLHQLLRDEPRLAAAAADKGVTLFDVRIPPADLTVGTGQKRLGRRLLTVGTDCSSGKMYTALALTKALRQRGIAADFRATGQTGILISGSGVPLDAVVADFMSGAIERLSPDRADGWDVIEGQGSLFHPSFAGVSTALLHGAQPDAIVMCHDPQRGHLRGLPGYPVPDLVDCIEANLAVARLTNPNVVAAGVALNTTGMSDAAALDRCAQTERLTGLTCTDPYRFGAEPIIQRLLELFPEDVLAAVARS